MFVELIYRHRGNINFFGKYIKINFILGLGFQFGNGVYSLSILVALRSSEKLHDSGQPQIVVSQELVLKLDVECTSCFDGLPLPLLNFTMLNLP